MRSLSVILGALFAVVPSTVCAGQPYLVSQADFGNIWRIEDTNGDGDALDSGERILWATGGDAIGGMQAVGNTVYAVEVHALSSNSRIVRLTDLNGDGDALDIGERVAWADGMAQPVDIARDEAGSFYVSDDVSGEIWRLVDANSDGDALDVGERTLFADAVDMPFMLLPWEDGLLAADYINDKVVLFKDANGDGDALDAAEQSTILSAVAFPSGLHRDGNGGLFVTSLNGGTAYRATDNNGDGDFLDVAEVLSYADGVFGSIDGPWNMTDYATGGMLLADYLGGEVRLVRDVDGDDDALDVGEVVLFADGVGAPVDIVALVEGLLGDYNDDGVVDAADYTVWRDAKEAGAMTLLNRDPNKFGPVDEDDYVLWRDNFGMKLGSGAGSGGAASTTVPEPNALVMLFVCGIMGLASRRHCRDGDRNTHMQAIGVSMCRVQTNSRRTNLWHWSGFATGAAVLWLVACSQARAQWSLAELFVPVTEDFSSFTAPSTWGTADPAANQLDSDIWGFSQTNDTGSASGAFGLNYIFGRGVNTGGVSTFGVYAFDAGGGVKGIGPQADDDAWSPGHLTIKLQNDSGSEIDALHIEWSYLYYNDQDGRRASQLLVSPTDAGGSYIAPIGGELATPDAPQVSPSWGIASKDVTWNVSLSDGGEYYLRWSFKDLPGFEGSGVDRDEVGIGNLRVTPIVSLDGDYNIDGAVDAADYTVWRDAKEAGATTLLNRDPSKSGPVDEDDYMFWRDNFGMSFGSGAGAGSVASPTVPEPNTLAMLIVGGILTLVGRRDRPVLSLD